MSSSSPFASVVSVAPYVYFTSTQYIILLTVGSISSILSIIGSSIIIYLVTRRKNLWREKDQLYHRIVLGLSIMDIIFSIAVLVSPYANRRDTGLFFAYGNAASCEWAAFFFLFYIGPMYYNCVLSIYFVRVIRYGHVPGSVFSSYEGLLHAIAFIVPIAFGISGIVIGAFNPLPYYGFCGFTAYPWNSMLTDTVHCERGCNRILWLSIFQSHSVLSMLLAVIGIICTWLVYWTIQQQARKNQRWIQGGQSTGLDEVQRKRTRAVAMQAIWYTLILFIGFVSLIVQQVMDAVFFQDGILKGRDALYASLVIMFAIFPLQGFLNGFIYVRPRVIRLKETHPDESWLWAYRQLFSTPSEGFSYLSKHSTRRPAARNGRGSQREPSEGPAFDMARTTNPSLAIPSSDEEVPSVEIRG